jgi:hypothetical protein
MSSVSCPFCSHANPQAAKFCNQCGSPLDLQPCPKCEAMNHVAVEQCHQCGAPLRTSGQSASAEPLTAATTAPVSEPASAGGADAMPDSIPIALSSRMAGDPEPEPVSTLSAPRAAAAPEQRAAPRSPPSADDAGAPPMTVDARYPPWQAPRRRGALRVVLAAVGVCVIAGAALYAYEGGLMPAMSDLSDALPAKDAQPPVTPGGSASGTADGATPRAPEAPRDETIAPAVAPRAAPPTGPAMAPAPTPQVTAPAQSSSPEPESTTRPALTTPPAASARSSSAAPSAGTAAQRPPASSRTARTPARQGDAPSQADKDALATQRLIERDLKGFVAPEGPRDPGSRSP